MAIQSDKNLYPGINAHLNSALQNAPDGWISFHHKHVTHLDDALSRVLPPGYFTRTEASIQITGMDERTGAEFRSTTQPDVAVFQRHPSASGTASSAAQISPATPTATMPILDTFPETESLGGVVIYQAGEGGGLGRPVTRIELLSPSNKPGGSHYEQYLVKRYQTLSAGLRLVELDYLHESPPVIQGLAAYPAEGAFPYLILISDPRPTLDKGLTAIYGVGVDEPLPRVVIPLAGADGVAIDLNAVYQYTFESSAFYSLLVDYAQNPTFLNRYRADDQARLAALLDSIRHNIPKD